MSTNEKIFQISGYIVRCAVDSAGCDGRVSGAHLERIGQSQRETWRRLSGELEVPTKRRRYLMVLTGVMPAIAITAGLLSLPPESVTRQQYWPWLSVFVLVVGLAFSSFFWIFFAGRGDSKDSKKRE